MEDIKAMTDEELVNELREEAFANGRATEREMVLVAEILRRMKHEPEP